MAEKSLKLLQKKKIVFIKKITVTIYIHFLVELQKKKILLKMKKI